MIKICEKNIQKALFQKLADRQHKWICPNIRLDAFYQNGEMDLISVNKSDFLTEFEIKISRSDFKADCKKRKHSMRKFLDKLPNYFYYVTPKDLIKVEEVPDYAGLIYIDFEQKYLTDYVQTIKKSPLAHKKAIDQSTKLQIGHLLMWRMWTRTEFIQKVTKS